MSVVSEQDNKTGGSKDHSDAPVGDKGEVTEQVALSLSALIDGQASEMEVHRLLKAAQTDASVRATWARYQMASASIRSSVAPGPLVDLSAAVRDAIEAEETYSTGVKSRWRGTVAKLGVAASVAALMVFTTQFVGVQPGGSSVGGTSPASLAGAGEQEKPLALDSNPAMSLPAGFRAPSLRARVVSSRPDVEAPNYSNQSNYYPVVTRPQTAIPVGVTPSADVQAYLQRVMEIHAGNAAINSGRGLLPYARVPVAEGE